MTVAGEPVRAFVPSALPPDPPLAMSGDLQPLLEAAVLALGRLDGVSTLLPDKSLFLYAYVRKEAVLSSQIEGTQSSLSDLLLFELDEAPGVPLDDVVEVSNYIAALDHGLARLREAWLTFFLEGVKEVAEGSIATAERLGELFRADRARIEGAGRRAGSGLRVHEALKARPIQSMPALCAATGLSFPAVSSAVDLLVELKLARELTGKRRNRLFVYDRYLAMLNEGTEQP